MAPGSKKRAPDPNVKYTYEYEVEDIFVTGLPSDTRAVRLILHSNDRKLAASDSAELGSGGVSGGTAAIKNFGFKTKLKRGPNAPLANTLVPKLAQLSLQAKRDSGSGSRSTGLLSFFDSWEDLAVASLDLAALANRKEDLGFGTEAGVPPAASIQAGAVVRRHVAWTNPQAEGVGLMLTMGSFSVREGRSAMRRCLQPQASGSDIPAPTARADANVAPTAPASETAPTAAAAGAASGGPSTAEAPPPAPHFKAGSANIKESDLPPVPTTETPMPAAAEQQAYPAAGAAAAGPMAAGTGSFTQQQQQQQQLPFTMPETAAPAAAPMAAGDVGGAGGAGAPSARDMATAVASLGAAAGLASVGGAAATAPLAGGPNVRGPGEGTAAAMGGPVTAPPLEPADSVNESTFRAVRVTSAMLPRTPRPSMDEPYSTGSGTSTGPDAAAAAVRLLNAHAGPGTTNVTQTSSVQGPPPAQFDQGPAAAQLSSAEAIAAEAAAAAAATTGAGWTRVPPAVAEGEREVEVLAAVVPPGTAAGTGDMTLAPGEVVGVTPMGGTAPEVAGATVEPLAGGEGPVGDTDAKSGSKVGAAAGSLATGVVASKAVAPALGAAEHGAKGLVGRVEEAAVAPVDAGAGLLHRAADTAIGVAKAPVQAVTGAIGLATDVAKTVVTSPVTAAGAVAKAAADTALGVAAVPVALVTGGPGAALAAGARALEAPLEAGRALVGGGAALGAAAAEAPAKAGAAVVRTAADVAEGAVTLPAEAIKSTIQGATAATTTLYEAPLEATRAVGDALSGGASAVATAPIRAADAAAHGAVDAVTGVITAPARMAAAAGEAVVSAAEGAVKGGVSAAESATKGLLGAGATAATAPVHGLAGVGKAAAAAPARDAAAGIPAAAAAGLGAAAGMGAAAVGRMMGRKGDVGEAELAPSGGPAYDTAAQSYTAERPGVSERVPMPGSVEEVEGQLPKVVPVEIGPGEGLGLMGATAPVVGDAARVLEGTRQEGEVIGFTPGGGVERYQPDLEAELASAGLKARGVSGREGAEEAREELRAEGDEARERRGGELATLCAARPQSVKPHGVAGGILGATADTVKAAAAAVGLEPLADAAERSVASLADGAASVVTAPVSAAAGAAKAVIGAAAGATGAVVGGMGSVTRGTMEAAKTVVTSPVTAAGAVAKAAADTALGAAAVPVALVTGGPGAALAAGARALEAPLEAGRALVGGGAALGAAAAEAPAKAGAAAVRTAADVAEGAVTLPAEAIKSTIQGATAATTALYKAPLEAARAIGDATSGGASAAATAPFRAADAAARGTVDAATSIVTGPVEAAAAVTKKLAEAGAAVVTAPLDAAGAVVSGAIDATAAVIKAPIHGIATLARGGAGAAGAHGRMHGMAGDIAGGVLQLPARAAATSGRAMSGIAGVALAIIGLSAGAMVALVHQAWSTVSAAALWALHALGLRGGPRGLEQPLRPRRVGPLRWAWRHLAWTAQWSSEVLLGATLVTMLALKGLAGLLSNWLRDEQSPLLAPLSTELREQRAAALRRGMVPPPAHIHHAHHGNGMQPGVEERGGGGGGGVPLYAYGLLGAAAVPAGVMMADAVAGGDKERSRGGAGEERGFPDEDEEEEEDEYGRSVREYHERVLGLASPTRRPPLRERLEAIRRGTEAGLVKGVHTAGGVARKGARVAREGAHVAGEAAEGVAKGALLLGAVPVVGTAAAAGTAAVAAVALPAAGAYGAYAGTKAAVGATADAAKASRGALGHVAHWAWSGLEWVGDVAERAATTFAAIALLGLFLLRRMADAVARGLGAAAGDAAGSRADRLAARRQTALVRRLGSRYAGVMVLPSPLKHLALPSAARAFIAAGPGRAASLGGMSRTASGSSLGNAEGSNVAPSEAGKQHAQPTIHEDEREAPHRNFLTNILSKLFLPAIIVTAALAAFADFWAWRLRQLLVHIWYLTIGRTTLDDRRTATTRGQPLFPGVAPAGIGAATTQLPSTPPTARRPLAPQFATSDAGDAAAPASPAAAVAATSPAAAYPPGQGMLPSGGASAEPMTARQGAPPSPGRSNLSRPALAGGALGVLGAVTSHLPGFHGRHGRHGATHEDAAMQREAESRPSPRHHGHHRRHGHGQTAAAAAMPLAAGAGKAAAGGGGGEPMPFEPSRGRDAEMEAVQRDNEIALGGGRDHERERSAVLPDDQEQYPYQQQQQRYSDREADRDRVEGRDREVHGGKHGLGTGAGGIMGAAAAALGLGSREGSGRDRDVQQQQQQQQQYGTGGEQYRGGFQPLMGGGDDGSGAVYGAGVIGGDGGGSMESNAGGSRGNLRRYEQAFDSDALAQPLAAAQALPSQPRAQREDRRGSAARLKGLMEDAAEDLTPGECGNGRTADQGGMHGSERAAAAPMGPAVEGADPSRGRFVFGDEVASRGGVEEGGGKKGGGGLTGLVGKLMGRGSGGEEGDNGRGARDQGVGYEQLQQGHQHHGKGPVKTVGGVMDVYERGRGVDQMAST